MIPLFQWRNTMAYEGAWTLLFVLFWITHNPGPWGTWNLAGKLKGQYFKIGYTEPINWAKWEGWRGREEPQLHAGADTRSEGRGREASIGKLVVFTESCKLEVEGPGFHFFPSPTAQLWLPSEMIKTKRISVSGIHFSPRCHLLPFLSCSFSSWESLLLHAFLLALRRFPVYTNYRCFHLGGGGWFKEGLSQAKGKEEGWAEGP